MKTLDEVIKAVHHCGLLTGFDDTYEYDGGCPYEDCSLCEKKEIVGEGHNPLSGGIQGRDE